MVGYGFEIVVFDSGADFLFLSIIVNAPLGPAVVDAAGPLAGAFGQAAPPRDGLDDFPRPASCTLHPLVLPATPSKIPGYTELDPTTDLHVTGSLQKIDLEKYRLEVTGKVDHPLRLAFDELRCMPRVAARPTLVSHGFFADTATWAGVPLKYVLDLAGVQPGATGVRLIGADDYSSSLSILTAMEQGNFLAYEWEGKALPRLHGFPIRAILPGLEGNQWVKWLVRIEVY